MTMCKTQGCLTFNAANGKIYIDWDATTTAILRTCWVTYNSVGCFFFSPAVQKTIYSDRTLWIRTLFILQAGTRQTSLFYLAIINPSLPFVTLSFATDVTFQPTTFALSKVHFANPRLRFLHLRIEFLSTRFLPISRPVSCKRCCQPQGCCRERRLTASSDRIVEENSQSIVSSIKGFNSTRRILLARWRQYLIRTAREVFLGQIVLRELLQK